jgi:hypothetical protein
LAFLTVAFITIGSIIGEGGLAIAYADPSHNIQTVFASLDFAWKAGVGAIFGLLGGRSV